MKLARICTFAAVTALSVLATAQPAEASTARCELVAQPWDGRSYALTAVIDGTPQSLIARQSGLLDGQTAWEFNAGSITEVWWAAKDPARQSTADDFYDVLPVGPDCRFTVAYHATAGHRDSVIIRPVAAPPTSTTTTSAPATTTAPPSTITFATTPAPPSTSAPEPVTTTTPPVVDVPLSAPPTTTTTSPVELFTATSLDAGTAGNPDLPLTGANTSGIALLGMASITLGVLLAGLARLRTRTIKENQQS